MTTTPPNNPDDEAVNFNLPRAEWALAIIDAYAAEHGIDRRTAFKDVQSNHRHGADLAGFDFDEINEEAREQHGEEVEQEGGEEHSPDA